MQKWFLVLGVALILIASISFVYAQGMGNQDPVASDHPSSSKAVSAPVIPVKPVASATPSVEPVPSS